MKVKTKKPFSFLAENTEHFTDKKDKIEIVGCFLGEMVCKEHLLMINKNYLESDRFRREKNYKRSIEILKNTYYKTTELTNTSCLKCTTIFRSTITDSLNSIKEELKGLTTGFFANKRYLSSYKLIEKVIQEIEDPTFSVSTEKKKLNEHYIGAFKKKNVI